MSESLQFVCAACGATNRVAGDKVRGGAHVICGRCKSPLMAPAEPLTVTDDSFAAMVERSPLPVLVDLWAPWCGPCRTLSPVIDQLAQEMAGQVRVAKVNVDENPRTASRFQVQGIPALLVFKGGREVDRLVGLQPKAAITRRLQAAIA